MDELNVTFTAEAAVDVKVYRFRFTISSDTLATVIPMQIFYIKFRLCVFDAHTVYISSWFFIDYRQLIHRA